METFLKILFGIGAIFLFLALMAIIMALPIMLLWNWLMPEIFGLPIIGFWQALGLGLLSACFFKTTVNTKSKD